MRYPASENLEVIRTVEASHLPVKKTLDMLCIPRTTFYRWYDSYLAGGLDGLADRSPSPGLVWNRIPEAKRNDLIEFALEYEALTPRELAIKYTDQKRYFVSESSVYRILKAADLITAPSHVTIKAASEFHDKTVRINEMWQTDFTYFKIIGWGWYYLSTILDDYSRYIIAWKLCTTMKAGDVTDTLEMALEASGCDQATVRHKPRLLSDNVLMLHLGRIGRLVRRSQNGSRSRRSAPPANTGQDRALAPDHEEPCAAWKTIICLETWSVRLGPSSNTITTSATTRA